MMFIVSKPLFRLRPDHRRINVDDGAMKIIRRHRTFHWKSLCLMSIREEKKSPNMSISHSSHIFLPFSRAHRQQHSLLSMFSSFSRKKSKLCSIPTILVVDVDSFYPQWLELNSIFCYLSFHILSLGAIARSPLFTAVFNGSSNQG